MSESRQCSVTEITSGLQGKGVQFSADYFHESERHETFSGAG